MVKKLSEEKTPTKKEIDFQNILSNFLTRQLPRIIICLAIFLGGILILFLKIPVWSLILGLPITQIGFIFLIFTLDDIAKNKIGVGSLYAAPCSICGQPTITYTLDRDKICPQCRKEIKEKLAEQKN